jgi:hypothetical protein
MTVSNRKFSDSNNAGIRHEAAKNIIGRQSLLNKTLTMLVYNQRGNIKDEDDK